MTPEQRDIGASIDLARDCGKFLNRYVEDSVSMSGDAFCRKYPGVRPCKHGVPTMECDKCRPKEAS